MLATLLGLIHVKLGKFLQKHVMEIKNRRKLHVFVAKYNNCMEMRREKLFTLDNLHVFDLKKC